VASASPSGVVLVVANGAAEAGKERAAARARAAEAGGDRRDGRRAGTRA